ncbi:MAG: Eco57I restriction-modification methylase domain-containing protein [Candidatus Bathyarchaeia archaeon]
MGEDISLGIKLRNAGIDGSDKELLEQETAVDRFRNKVSFRTRRDDFSHKIAKLLLKQIFYEMLIPRDASIKNNLDLLIEATRIIALDLVISRSLHLDIKEVVRNPELGITCISNKRLSKPDIAVKIFELVIENITRFKDLPLLGEIEDLDRYDLVKILEAIHEVSVYTPSEFISERIYNSSSHIIETDGIRKQRGAFYTPIEITEFICENTIGRFFDEIISKISKAFDEAYVSGLDAYKEIKRIFEISIVDPACGPGTFLSSSLKVLEARRRRLLEIVKKLQMYPLSEEEKFKVDYWIDILEDEREFLKYFEGRVYGVDLDSAALEVASVCLSLLSGRNPLLEGLKVPFGVNLKEGNSLISELPPKNVKLDPQEVQKLLDLRQRIRDSRLDERNEILKEYKDTIAQLQRRLPTCPTVKRASQFFKNLDEKKAFCWELEFPEVFYNDKGDPERGFDLLVMNPPYDLLKPNRLEFIKLYGTKNSISAVEFESLKRVLNEEVKFYRESGHYSLATSNVLNLYKLMLERALYITCPTGRLGFIVPSTLLCDESAAKLRREILSRYKIDGVFEFLESARVFTGVSQSVCIMIINKSLRGNSIPLAMNLTKIDDLWKITPTIIPMDWVKNFSSFRIPKVNEVGWKILEKIHANPKLSDLDWILNLRGEVDLTVYKDCLSKDTGSLLIRGNNISRYVLRRSSGRKESFIQKEKFLNMLGNSIKAEHVEDRRIAGQQISNMMQRWRLKFCMVEAGMFLGNSCNYIYIKKEKSDRESLYLYLLALLNSTLLNWRFKITSTNNHVSNTELGMLPIKLIDTSNEIEKRIFNLIVERVRAILKSGVSCVDAKIEAAIFLLYGLTSDEIKFVLLSEGAADHEIRNVLEAFCELKRIGSLSETSVV